MFRIFAFVGLTIIHALQFPSHNRIVWEDEIRPLAWTSPTVIFVDGILTFGEPAVQNHCTAWAYRTKDNPTQLHWITAAHCLLDEESGALEDHDYQIDGHPVYPEDWRWPEDVASLTDYAGVQHGLTLAKTEPLAGKQTRLTIRSYPLGVMRMFTFGGFLAARDVSFDQDYDIYQVPDAPGSSGSPVFDAHDRVIGLVQIGWSHTFGPVSGGLSLSKLQQFLHALP